MRMENLDIKSDLFADNEIKLASTFNNLGIAYTKIGDLNQGKIYFFEMQHFFLHEGDFFGFNTFKDCRKRC